MGKRLQLVPVLLVLALGIVAAQDSNAADADGGAAEFKVIVHASNPMSSISSRDLSRLYLKKDLEWPDGAEVVAIDLDPDSATRAAFSMAVHGRKVASIKSYWQRQIFAGKAVPPQERSNQAEVIVFVSRNPAAVGYVTPSAPMIDNLKVLQVTD